MLRLVKFTVRYFRDGDAAPTHLDSCWTDPSELRIYSHVAPDDCTEEQFRAVCADAGIRNVGPALPMGADYRKGAIRWLAMTDKVVTTHGGRQSPVFVALVTIPEPYGNELPVSVRVNRKMTQERFDAMFYNGPDEYGIQDIVDLHGEKNIVLTSWDYYLVLPLMGYSRKSFEKFVGTSETVFDDSVFECQGCNVWDYNDDGYQYNYRIVNDCEQLGTKCGCYADHCRDNLADYVNDAEKAVERDLAEELVDAGTLVHCERYIGGWVDGRGGYFDGQSTREGTPESALKEWQVKLPGAEFVFSHDESGQFQTYFSIYRVLEGK